MYRNCIFCSASLGANEAIEMFPVGRQLAFDAWKGRLWAVCPACSRWNLSPIEERWEAVEAAEQLFRDAKLRVHSENVGLAQLRDGTRLVRVGQAVPGELSAWRYGRQLLRRRKRYFLAGGASLAGAAAFYGGLSIMGLGFGSFWIGSTWWDSRRKQQVLYRAPAADLVSDGASATTGLVIRRWQLDGMNLHASRDEHGVAVHIRDAHHRKPGGWSEEVDRNSNDIAIVTGESARALLKRSMVHVNRKGASRASLDEANRILAEAGSAERILREAATGGAALGKRAGRDPAVLMGPGALAFEMALNDAAERRALEGELAALEAAWREAEEIAAIADALPGAAVLNRLLDRLRTGAPV
jgi:hypothetical protein